MKKSELFKRLGPPAVTIGSCGYAIYALLTAAPRDDLKVVIALACILCGICVGLSFANLFQIYLDWKARW